MLLQTFLRRTKTYCVLAHGTHVYKSQYLVHVTA